MSALIADREPRNGRLIPLFALSVAVHLAIVAVVLWLGQTVRFEVPPVMTVDLGTEVTLGTEVQERVVAETPPAVPETPTPIPPEPPLPELPKPVEKPDFAEPASVAKTTPAPKVRVAAKSSAIPAGAKTGATPHPGVVGGNVTQGKLAGTPGGAKVGDQGWRTPRPPYPPAALAARIQGSGAVSISTDASGKVTRVSISAPIHPLLDANTRSFALANWKGPPNATRTVPVIYQIR